jgi:hypothetical protein
VEQPTIRTWSRLFFKGKTIVQSFGDGLFIYRQDLTGFHKTFINQRDFDLPKPNRLATR